MERVNFYAILQLSPDSDPEAIKAALNEKIRDVQAAINSRDPQARKQAEEKMKILLEARKVLLDPVKSKEYRVSLEKLGLSRPTQVTTRSPAIRQEKRSPASDNIAALEKSLKIAVTPPGYDNIGEIIAGMGYRFTQISDLSKYDVLRQFDILFLNCREFVSDSTRSKESLQRFVAEGGMIYASDLEAPRISTAFPKYIGFKARPMSGTHVKAYVVDPDLVRVLGQEVEIYFDIVQYFTSTWNKDVNIYLEAPIWDVIGYQRTPIVISFRYGQGEVFYTSFHNRAQPGEQERKLLKFLVLKPVADKAHIPVLELAQKKGLLGKL